MPQALEGPIDLLDGGPPELELRRRRNSLRSCSSINGMSRSAWSGTKTTSRGIRSSSLPTRGVRPPRSIHWKASATCWQISPLLCDEDRFGREDRPRIGASTLLVQPAECLQEDAMQLVGGLEVSAGEVGLLQHATAKLLLAFAVFGVAHRLARQDRVFAQEEDQVRIPAAVAASYSSSVYERAGKSRAGLP